MRLKYLESGDLFTSNGLFKIRNKFSRKKFPYFTQFLAKSSCLPYLYTVPDVLIFGAVKCLKEVKSRFWFTSKM